MKKSYVNALIAFSLLMFFSSCSVVGACAKVGPTPNELGCCQNKSELIEHGMSPYSCKRSDAGQLCESYNWVYRQPSFARSVFHATLDYCTWGIWEIPATLYEYSLINSHSTTVKVYYESDDETIDKITITDKEHSKMYM